ncbi:MAG: tyrosine-protein phosphatase [Planctomycetota bacterium]
MRRGIFLSIAVVVLLALVLYALGPADLLAVTGRAQEKPTATRPSTWATALERPGLTNFHQVTADLYRGAQPTAEGMRQLEKLGVKTVVNLRTGHSDREDLVGSMLDYEEIPIEPWKIEEEEVARFLRVVSDPARMPVFVHCRRGADRTGLACAVYRIAVCGWSKEEAIREMTRGGFAFASTWGNMVRYLEKLDVERLRHLAKDAGNAREKPSEGGGEGTVR